MKDYVINYITGYLEDVLEHDYIGVGFMCNKLKIIYRWGFIIVNIEIDEHFIKNNDTIQISRRCKREICNKVLSLMHKEESYD
jgi:hypothetical protein